MLSGVKRDVASRNVKGRDESGDLAVSGHSVATRFTTTCWQPGMKRSINLVERENAVGVKVRWPSKILLCGSGRWSFTVHRRTRNANVGLRRNYVNVSFARDAKGPGHGASSWLSFTGETMKGLVWST